MRMVIVCLSYGERGESQWAWKKPGASLAEVKAQRRAEAEEAAAVLGAEIDLLRRRRLSPAQHAGDARPARRHLPRGEARPSCSRHSLADPYNVDHPEATRLAQEARIIAQAAGHKPSPDLAYSAPPMFLFEPHQPEQCDFKPNVILNIDEVWETKRRAFEVLAAQKHLWEYYTRVALNRGMQGGRNSGRSMTYGEAYQRLFPMVVETLA